MDKLILHITTVPQSLYGFFDGQFRYMRAKGYNIHAASSPGEFLKEFSEREEVPVYEVKMAREINLFADLISLTKLIFLFQRLNPAIVHAHTPKAGLLGMLAAFILRVPVRVYHIHGLPIMTAQGVKRKILIFTEWLSCLLASKVYTVSRSLRSFVTQQQLCRPEKISTLEHGSINGLDAQRKFNPNSYSCQCISQLRSNFNLSDAEFVFGFVGRLTRDKGIAEICKAWRRIEKEHRNVHLLMVGPLEENHGLQKDCIEYLNLNPRIHLVGRILEIAPVYKLIDALVFPTYREGFGLAAIEASAMKVPVIATRIPGCVDAVVENVTGILIPPADAEALYQAMMVYCGDSQLRGRHGRAGRERVLKLFRQEPIWKALCRDYDRLIATDC